MHSVSEAIVVEGRYDKNTLSQVINATIFETSGFSIMHNKEQLELLRNVAIKRGLIVFTDSDGAGFVIRNFLKSSIPPEYLKHAYIPDVYGKERRKTTAGKEGKIGVEGMPPEVIVESLRRAGATFAESVPSLTNIITKQDFFELGLSGCSNSSSRRKLLLRYLGLPEHMSANAMLQAVRLLCTKTELAQILSQISE